MQAYLCACARKHERNRALCSVLTTEWGDTRVRVSRSGSRWIEKSRANLLETRAQRIALNNSKEESKAFKLRIPLLPEKRLKEYVYSILCKLGFRRLVALPVSFGVIFDKECGFFCSFACLRIIVRHFDHCRDMVSPVNEGNEVLVVSGDDVSSNDTADFIATIKQRVGHSGKLQIASLSDMKKGIGHK